MNNESKLYTIIHNTWIMNQSYIQSYIMNNESKLYTIIHNTWIMNQSYTQSYITHE